MNTPISLVRSVRSVRLVHSLALFTLLAAGTAYSADWPQWRGPQRDGISRETGLLKEWPAEGPKLVWTGTGLGTGYSGVSVANDRIYTMGDDADSTYLRAIEAPTGKLLWSAKVSGTGNWGGRGYPGPRCTPTVAGDVVIALGQFGDLVCVEAATGKELWHRNLEKDFGGKMPWWGYAESPLVDGDKVLVTPFAAEGAMVALNKKTGELLWQTKDWTDKAGYSSVIIATICGVRQYVQLANTSVVGISPDDGRVLWQTTREAKNAVITTPIVDDNLVYTTSSYGTGCNLFRVEAEGDKLTAKEVYANKTMANHHGGVVKVGDYLYGFSDGKGWVCQDFKTGQELWAEKEKLNKGSLTCADGLLYLRSEGGKENSKGTMVLIEPSPKGWTEKGRFEQADRTDKNAWAHPVVANGRLYLRDQDILLCYDVKRP